LRGDAFRSGFEQRAPLPASHLLVGGQEDAERAPLVAGGANRLDHHDQARLHVVYARPIGLVAVGTEGRRRERSDRPDRVDVTGQKQRRAVAGKLGAQVPAGVDRDGGAERLQLARHPLCDRSRAGGVAR